jgi:hypothetical protein
VSAFGLGNKQLQIWAKGIVRANMECIIIMAAMEKFQSIYIMQVIILNYEKELLH